MKPIYTILLLILSLFIFSCFDDNVDVSGPEIRGKWIISPPVEGISDVIELGDKYTISIKAGFHLILEFQDQNSVQSGFAFFLVNNDPVLRQDIIIEGTVFGYNKGQVVYVFRSDKILLDNGEFYDIKAGDKYFFRAEFSDGLGNMSFRNWTIDVVE